MPIREKAGIWHFCKRCGAWEQQHAHGKLSEQDVCWTEPADTPQQALHNSLCRIKPNQRFANRARVGFCQGAETFVQQRTRRNRLPYRPSAGDPAVAGDFIKKAPRT